MKVVGKRGLKFLVFFKILQNLFLDLAFNICSKYNYKKKMLAKTEANRFGKKYFVNFD